jgi:ABC-type multidrug transport system ATPase subunit
LQVGRSVFHNCILTALAGKTRVLVTNQLQLLRHCDRVLMLAKGGVRHFGSFEDLTRRQSSELSNVRLICPLFRSAISPSPGELWFTQPLYPNAVWMMSNPSLWSG